MPRARPSKTPEASTPTGAPEDWPTLGGGPAPKKRPAPDAGRPEGGKNAPDRPASTCPDCQQFVSAGPGGLEHHAFMSGCGYPPKCKNVREPKLCRPLEERKLAWQRDYWQCPRCLDWITRRHRSGVERGQLHEGGPYAHHAFDMRPLLGGIEPCYFSACAQQYPDSREIALMESWAGDRVYCPSPNCPEPWQRKNMVRYHFHNFPDCSLDSEARAVIGAAMAGRPEHPRATIVRIFERRYGWGGAPGPPSGAGPPSADEDEHHREEDDFLPASAPPFYRIRNTFVEFGARETENPRSQSVPPSWRCGAVDRPHPKTPEAWPEAWPERAQEPQNDQEEVQMWVPGRWGVAPPPVAEPPVGHLEPTEGRMEQIRGLCSQLEMLSRGLQSSVRQGREYNPRAV